MASNSFGEFFRITTFGESHGPAVGVIVDGVPAGIALDLEAIQRDMDRRRPGGGAISTARKERDEVEVLSGLFEGMTTGSPMALMIRNHDARSTDYETIKDLFRPGHADYTWLKKYGIRDWRGGGRSSGRETAARVAAGALAKQIISRRGMKVIGHVISIGEIAAKSFDIMEIERNPVRCADAEAATLMEEAIKRVKAEGDSLGGIVEIIAEGVPAGLGDPVFLKLEARLGAALLSIGAVKGVEFGGGFELARMRGSESNDQISPRGFMSNRAGGILGGISNGEPVVARIAVKPTSSIAREQKTVDTSNRQAVITVPGRHDPCICPRIVPVAEAMTALVLCDAMLMDEALG